MDDIKHNQQIYLNLIFICNSPTYSIYKYFIIKKDMIHDNIKKKYILLPIKYLIHTPIIIDK